MKKIQVKKLIQSILKEQMGGIRAVPMRGRPINRPISGPDVSQGGGYIPHTLIELVKWLDVQPEAKKPTLWDRIKHLKDAISGNCGGPTGGCPMPH